MKGKSAIATEIERSAQFLDATVQTAYRGKHRKCSHFLNFLFSLRASIFAAALAKRKILLPEAEALPTSLKSEN
jgi:hypothetical protein